MTGRAPRFTVVVPVLNDAVRLRRCLAAIAANRVVPHELVVVDNGSTDGSADVARTAGACVLVMPGQPVSALRNAGARAGSAPLVAFVDADNLVPGHWLAEAQETLNLPQVGAAGADYRSEGRTWVQHAYDALRRRPAHLTPADWLPSGSLAVRRDAFHAAGGFDEALDACEDVDLARRLRQCGHRLVASPALASVHLGDPDTLGAVFHGERWRGRDNLRVSLRPPVSWRSVGGLALSTGVGASLPLVATLLAAGAHALAALTALLCVLLLTLKTSRACAAHHVRGLRNRLGVWLVIGAYEAGRGLALLWPASHVRRRMTPYTPAVPLP